MTAKEKANELGNKFYRGNIFTHGKEEHLKEIKEAKQCALIAVNEIIKVEFETVKKLLEVIKNNNIRLVISFNEDYWQEVKQEIHNL